METVASQAVGIHNEMSGKHVVRPAPRLNFWRNRIDAPRPRQSRRGFLRWSNLFLWVRSLICSFSSASFFSFYSDWPEMARGLNCRRFRGARWFCGPPQNGWERRWAPIYLTDSFGQSLSVCIVTSSLKVLIALNWSSTFSVKRWRCTSGCLLPSRNERPCFSRPILVHLISYIFCPFHCSNQSPLSLSSAGHQLVTKSASFVV